MKRAREVASSLSLWIDSRNTICFTLSFLYRKIYMYLPVFFFLCVCLAHLWRATRGGWRSQELTSSSQFVRSRVDVVPQLLCQLSLFLINGTLSVTWTN
jgi:hypothetical protein